MPELDPKALRRARELRGLSQEELQSRSTINKQTISNLERGSRRSVRARTIKELARALGVQEEVLSGRAMISEETPFDRRSQLSLRIDDSARNALTLVALRYRLTPAQVVELAPFLLFWAAERSLLERRERLDLYEQELGRLSGMRDGFPHLSDLLAYFPHVDAIIEAEGRSIEARDLFAAELTRGATDETSPADFMEGLEGPLPRFLMSRAQEVGAVFEEWSSDGSPTYQVCREEALRLVDGDVTLATRVLDGVVPLHRMPPEIARGGAAGRKQWVADEADRAAADADAFFRAIGVDPSTLEPLEEAR